MPAVLVDRGRATSTQVQITISETLYLTPR